MDGYKIDFGAAKQAVEQLNTILEDLANEIKKIQQVEQDMLSDANWQGPNKSAFLAEFSEYEMAVKNLHQNGVEHLEALQSILSTYASAEQ